MRYLIALFFALPLCAQEGATGATSYKGICADSSGSGTTQVCSTRYVSLPIKGDVINYTTTTANTGALTVAVNGGSAAAVQKWQGAALVAGDIKVNVPVLMTFDGTNWQLSTIGNAPSAGGGTTLSTIGAGWFAPFGGAFYSASGSTTTATSVYVYQFVCCSGVSIAVNTISWETWTTSAGGHQAAAIYADSSGAPGSLLGFTGGTSLGFQAAQFGAMNATLTLNAGTVYWVGIAQDNTTSTWTVAGNPAGFLEGILAQPSHPRGGTCNNAVSWAAAVATFPATCGGMIGLGGQREPILAILP